MTFFTEVEFKAKYTDYQNIDISAWKIEAVSEMIYSQIGLTRRGAEFTTTTVPLVVKNASMEQMRFMLEHDIPFVDSKVLSAGGMSAELQSDYSTLALRMLGNAGYTYRGNPLTQNMGLDLPFGG